MAELATFRKQGNVGIVALNNPPVNALAHALRLALRSAFSEALADPAVKAILLCCEGRTFVAGADIREFDMPPLEPDVPEIVEWVGNCSKPVTAALHGTALGGGVELALACHFRVAVPDAQLGFPEVGLGILPGAGGTQRLPRLIGVRAALDMIVSGAPIAAPRALELGLIDEIVEGDLLTGALAFVERMVASQRPLGRVSDRKVDFDEPGYLDAYEARLAAETRGFLAPSHCVQAIRAAVELPFEQGLKRERELFLDLVHSPQSKGQRHAFFGEREVARSPRLPREVRPVDVRSVVVLGEGERATQIGKIFESRRIPVTVLGSGLRLADFKATDLVVMTLDGEALGEAFAVLDDACSPAVALAICSPEVNVGQAASRSKQPERIVGLRFEGARLMEVIATERTSPVACATVMNLSKVLRRVAVLERADQGSAGERLRAACLREARALIDEGNSLTKVNGALCDLGTLRVVAPSSHQPSQDSTHPEQGQREIRERCLYALVNEGARLLEEGVVARALEVDMVAMCGLDFPVYLGGPLFHADQLGVESVYQGMLRHRNTDDERSRMAPLLAKLSAEGRGFYS